MLKNLLTTYDNISVGTPSGVERLADDSPMHPPPKTEYSLARNKYTSRGHQIRPRGKDRKKITCVCARVCCASAEFMSPAGAPLPQQYNIV